MEKFDSIRPYNESEFTDAIKRITSHEYLPIVINTVFLNTNAEEYIEKMKTEQAEMLKLGFGSIVCGILAIASAALVAFSKFFVKED